jgi:hypothetical protein
VLAWHAGNEHNSLRALSARQEFNEGIEARFVIGRRSQLTQECG